jgi:hypothetical protein
MSDPNLVNRFHELREIFEEDLARLLLDSQDRGMPLDVIFFSLHEAELITEWRIKNESKGDNRFIKKVRNLAKVYADSTIEGKIKK